MLLPQMLQQLGLAGVLLVAEITVMGLTGDATHGLGEGGGVLVLGLGNLSSSYRQFLPGVDFENVTLPLRAGLVDFITILTEEIFGGF